ncbi:MAG: hypothetical protein IH898_05695 [Planctomycetes bacterium]|nr:hypothetical protein [Planctomycetota bacterium]
MSTQLEDELLQMRRRRDQNEMELQWLRHELDQADDRVVRVPPSHLTNWSEVDYTGVASGVTLEKVDIITKPTHRIRGRLFFDHVMFDDDPALGVDRENETGFDTARMGMQGNIFENVKYQIEVEFEGTEVDFKTVYIEVNQLPWIDNFRIGHFYEAFAGLDEESGSRYQMFMERSLATSAFIPSRSYGYMAWDYWERPDVYWAVGTFRHESDDSPLAGGLIRGDSGDWVVTSRLAWTPYYDEPSDGRYVVHLGMGYSFRTDAEQVLFRTVTELGNQQGFLAATVPGDRDYSLYGPEFLLIWGPYSVQSEWYYAATGSNDFWGGYVEASYFLTGDHRGYDREQKYLTRPHIIENFFTVLTPSGLCKGTGAWELKARWSYVDLSHGTDPLPAVIDQSRGTQNNFLTGFNWYLNSYTRFMFDYLYENVDLVTGVTGNTHTFGTRMQVHW